MVEGHVGYVGPALLLSALVYSRAIATFFAQDDITFLARAAGIAHWTGLGRPLSENVTLGAEYALFRLNPLGYHIVNWALHLTNVAMVYVLALKLRASRAVAGSAAVLFGVSAIAFTPLHWTSGVIELLTCCLLLIATVVWVAAVEGSKKWHVVAALMALAAMFSKETAVVWPFALLTISKRAGKGRIEWRSLWPAFLASAVFCVLFLLSGQARRIESSEAYAMSQSPAHFIANLFTYAHWSVAVHEPIRDIVALADRNAWKVGLPVFVILGVTLWKLRGFRELIMLGLMWWLIFLLPVLPLMSHTYLYYLYIPSVGLAIAVSDLCRAMTSSWPRQLASALALIALCVYAILQARSIEVRRTAVRDALPIDRTLRDATLLRHALTGLRQAGLPPGAKVAFVNPVPAARFDVMTGDLTRREDLPHRVSYYPLEAALRGGETLSLFMPELVYVGFSDTIPHHWEDAEYFYFEQRGWLKSWGHGQQALMNQGAVQIAAGQWSAAVNTYQRVRALGDTLPQALEGQIVALVSSGRKDEAALLAAELLRRWPNRPVTPLARRLVVSPS